MIDTLRADHLGAYGSTHGLTPHLDALASRSFLFENAVATSSWTRSSIASMFTSRFPGSISVLDRNDAIHESYQTLAEALSDAGWRTFGVFSNGNASPSIGFAQGMDAWVWPQIVRSYDDGFRKVTAEGVTGAALEALEERERNAPEQPFFLYVHYIDPHDPYLPHPGLLPAEEPSGRFDGSRAELGRLDRLERNERTPEDRDRIRFLYAGEVKYCDLWVGRLLEGLESLGIARETLLLITADHGEGLWDHGRRAHGQDLHEEQIHVPLLLRFPAMTAKDAGRVTEPVSLVDLAPTVLRAARVERPPAFEGHDLEPLTQGQPRADSLRWVYSELTLDEKNFESMRHGNLKMIRNRGDYVPFAFRGYHFFDLARDPDERKDLRFPWWFGPEGWRLRRALDRWNEAITARAGAHHEVPAEELSPETAERLRALGYLQ